MPDPQTTDDPVTTEMAANTEHPVHDSIVAEIEPHSALPPELHGISYVDDVWARIKTHPLRNPVLFRSKLDEDPESREIIRQVMSAGEQREHQILMHNQARVFRHILARVVAGVSTFLNEPLLLAFRETPLQKANGDIPVNPPIIPKARGIISACIPLCQ